MFYSIQKLLRLCEKRKIQYQCYKQIHISGSVLTQKHEQNINNKNSFVELLEKNKDKIIFNSYLEHEKLELGYHKYHIKSLKKAKSILQKEYEEKCLPPLPVSLRYYVNNEDYFKEESANDKNVPEQENEFQLPFGKANNVEFDQNQTNLHVTDDGQEEFDRSDINKWMINYEYFDDTKMLSEQEPDEGHDTEWPKYYGTPDPNQHVSKVPCGGCGALLHCNDPAIPGYLPSEIFKNRNIIELKSLECQRCHFLKEYNIALDVSVHPEEYEKLLQSIRNVKSLVVLMVDLLDFPCSIWPGIVDIIGTERPIIIVGNKVDLLPGDSIGYLKRIKECLETELYKTRLGEANIKYIGMISAKTGYGVEELISAMFKLWMYKGDVYLVGCTNVGKSSLFNALLQSDYCKVHAVDIIKRATVSRWPGTTLNLLKFPINRPSGWKIYQRTRRLLSDKKLWKTEKEIRNAQLQGRVPSEAPALIGHIGRSFTDNIEDETINKPKILVFDEKHHMFAKSKWFYDTPGVIHPDQVLSLLSTEELLLTIPKKLIRPQTYYLRKGQSLFISGLARLDFVDCSEPCRFTVFCSECLPITVTQTEYADEIYNKFVGTELFAAPTGGEERLKNWPGLKEFEELFEFTGTGPKECCGDIVLSSVAWVAVTAKVDSVCSVRAWTPSGRGIHKRCPSLLPYSINLKGKRITDTPAYKVGTVFSDKT